MYTTADSDPLDLRASRGAVLRLPIGRGSLGELIAVAGAHQLVMLAAEPEPPEPTGAPESSRGGEASGRGPRGQPPTAPRSQQRKAGTAGVCLVLGSEGQGLSREVLSECTPVAIPMVGAAATGAATVHVPLPGKGNQGPGGEGDELAAAAETAGAMESLNVGVAGGILMFMLSEGLPQLTARLARLSIGTVNPISEGEG